MNAVKAHNKIYKCTISTEHLPAGMKYTCTQDFTSRSFPAYAATLSHQFSVNISSSIVVVRRPLKSALLLYRPWFTWLGIIRSHE